MNKQEVIKVEPSEFSVSEKNNNKEKAMTGNFLDLFKTRGLLRSTLIMYYLFFTNSFVYYGLTLNAGTLIPGNLHINIFVSGLLEIFANVFTIVAFVYAGRKISVFVAMGVRIELI